MIRVFVFLSGTKPFYMLVDFQILKKLFPYLNYLAIGMAIAKLVIYYKAFGIDIVQYLELSEALVLFFNDLLMFFALAAIMIIIAILGGHNIADKQGEAIEKVLSNPNKWKRLSAYCKENFYTTLLLLIFSFNNPFFIVLPFAHYLSYEANFVLRKRYGTPLNYTHFNEKMSKSSVV